MGFPGDSAGKESACKPGFNPWGGKIPWRREQLPTPAFWSGGFHGLHSPWGCKELKISASAPRSTGSFRLVSKI